MKRFEVKCTFRYSQGVGRPVVVEVPDGKTLDEVIDEMWIAGAYLGEPADPDIYDMDVKEWKEIA